MTLKGILQKARSRKFNEAERKATALLASLAAGIAVYLVASLGFAVHPAIAAFYAVVGVGLTRVYSEIMWWRYKRWWHREGIHETIRKWKGREDVRATRRVSGSW